MATSEKLPQHVNGDNEVLPKPWETTPSKRQRFTTLAKILRDAGMAPREYVKNWVVDRGAE